MGYTHYWAYDPKSEAFRANFSRLVQDARRIVDWARDTGIEIVGAMGEPDTNPILSESMISLNGSGTDSHETFHIALDPTPRELFRGSPYARSFCKTARKPYDVVVAAILLRARQTMAPAFVIGSDGRWDHEWVVARDLVRELFDCATVPDFTGEEFDETCHGPPTITGSGA